MREATANEQYMYEEENMKIQIVCAQLHSTLYIYIYKLYHECPLSSHRSKWILITPLVNASVAGALRAFAAFLDCIYRIHDQSSIIINIIIVIVLLYNYNYYYYHIVIAPSKNTCIHRDYICV